MLSAHKKIGLEHMLRPTFLGFEASKTGLYAAQKALDITGNNLNNINTEGYTRQRLVQTSNSAGDYTMRYKTNQVVYEGMGVDVKGVEQMRSKQLDQAFRSQYGTSGYYDKTSTMLSQIESVLSEVDNGKSGNGLGLRDAVSDMNDALQDFASNANSTAIAGVVAETFSNTCDVLNQKYKQLEDLEDTFKTELSAATDRVNEILKELSYINDKVENSMLANQYTGTFGPNELKDRRNILLDELSSYGSVKVEEISSIRDPKKDTVGGIKVEFNGQNAVQGKYYDRLILREVNGKVDLSWNSDASVMQAKLSEKGELKAYLDILNGTGPNPINEVDTSQRGFPYYKDKLDAFAQTLADTFNNILPMVDDSVIPNTNMFYKNGDIIYRTLFGEAQPGGLVETDGKVTAKNISITNALKTNYGYLVYDENSTENGYALAMVDQLTEKSHKFDTISDDYTGTFEDYITYYTSALGNDISYSETNLESSLLISKEILNSRAAVMGVSESEETVNMLTYNRAFQAAARMMNTMDEILNIIVNQIGALG
jgi:flagellar hook-associated protein 1 FlgK